MPMTSQWTLLQVNEVFRGGKLLPAELCVDCTVLFFGFFFFSSLSFRMVNLGPVGSAGAPILASLWNCAFPGHTLLVYTF